MMSESDRSNFMYVCAKFPSVQDFTNLFVS